MMTIELVKMFSCGASVKVIGTSRGCQRHFRGFRGISWASNGREDTETFNLFSILRHSLLQSWALAIGVRNSVFNVLYLYWKHNCKGTNRMTKKSDTKDMMKDLSDQVKDASHNLTEVRCNAVRGGMVQISFGGGRRMQFEENKQRFHSSTHKSHTIINLLRQ